MPPVHANARALRDALQRASGFMGHLNRESAYSPLWQMVKVTWHSGQSVYLLKSEEAVLDAAEKGRVTLEVTSVVLNCPILYRGVKGGLPGAVM